MDLVEREREILRILGKLKGKDFIVVGGYAVSALASHRFSVDCDLVVSSPMKNVLSTLKKEGYTLQKKRAGFDTLYGGRFERHAKSIGNNPVSIDLLVDSLVSRDTEASWSFGYIRKHSIAAEIGTPPVICRIPEKELLVAFKIHAARKADIRDIIMLNEGCDPDKVVAHVDRGKVEEVRNRIRRVIECLDDEKMIDSLKGVFRLQREVEMDIKRTKKFISGISKSLQRRHEEI